VRGKTLGEREPYVSAKQVAAYYGVGEAAVRQWARQGKLPFSRIGSAVRFQISDVEDFVEAVNVTKPKRRR
jgi:excisionase family DNA binding protein